MRCVIGPVLSSFVLLAAINSYAVDFPSIEQLPSHPELPDPLVMLNGDKVTTSQQWFQQRRPELQGLFQHYMYGFLPPAPANVSAKVEVEDSKYFGGKATKKQVTITYHPQAPAINLLLLVPNQRTKPAPVFVGINFCGNHTLVNDPRIPLPQTWIYSSCPGCVKDRATDAGRGGQAEVWNPELIIDRGYALATFYNGDIDPDVPDFTDGVHPHYLPAGQTKPGPDTWGTVAAWAWGAHRVVDYLVTNPDIDRERIAVVGHSRLGKASLVAGAFDDRIKLIIPHQAGCGGTAPSRQKNGAKDGESVKQINDRFPHWFDDEFTKFNEQTDKLPFDQNCLVALCAPRAVLFSNAVEDTWANPNGQFEVLKAAAPVYRFLMAGDLGADQPPEIGKLLDSRLGYFIRGGKHSMTKEDWLAFLDFADKQFGKPESGTQAAAAPVTFTTQQDHQQMLGQLGITKLRPGPSGNERDPRHANYDESQANPYPNLPNVLTLKSGQPVTTADGWWKERRPEIVEDFEREVVGRVPANVPKITWTVTETREIDVGGTPVIEKQLQGVADNSACPSIEVKIAMTLGTPKNATGKVPVLMMFSGFGFGPRPGAGANAPPRRPPPGFGPPGPSRTQQLVEAGWGYAMINPGSIQADNGAGLTRGIIGLTNLGQPRKPDDWGSLRAWAWGASRGLDYLETDAAVDAQRVGIEGVSRYGKAALVALAFEPRFAAGLIGSSGEGGAKLHRRNFGEAVENLTGSGEYHWMAGNFLKYGAEEASFGSKNAGDIPVDAHQLIALCAPRLTFISYGIPEKGDAKWLDQQGSFMATIAAGPVFRLLGAKDLGRSDDYLQEKLPDVNSGLLDGHLAWRQHDGGHTDGPNLPHFIAWAKKQWEPAKSSPDAAK